MNKKDIKISYWITIDEDIITAEDIKRGFDELLKNSDGVGSWGEEAVALPDEALENIHDLIMSGRYKEASDLFEKWFHEQIGSG